MSYGLLLRYQLRMFAKTFLLKFMAPSCRYELIIALTWNVNHWIYNKFSRDTKHVSYVIILYSVIVGLGLHIITAEFDELGIIIKPSIAASYHDIFIKLYGAYL